MASSKPLVKRFKYRIYPHPHQKRALAQAFGCARVVWNDALVLNRKTWVAEEKSLGAYALMKKCITQAKGTPERAWLGDVSVIVLQQSIRDLEKALKNWWRTLEKGGRFKEPRFKCRSNRQSVRLTRRGFRLYGEALNVAKVGSIPVAWSRPLPGVPSSVTLIKDCAGRYFASFVVEVERSTSSATGVTGIDLGLESLATFSGGEKVSPPKFLRSVQRRRRRLQRNLKHKQRGSNRYEHARVRVARLLAKVADRRTDFLHKLSTRIIRENQTVVLEDLNVLGLVKNRRLARSIADSGWRVFRRMLELKAENHGRDLVVISRWEPTSQRCSSCGHRDGKKPLSVRRWQCPNCGADHDRDVNAAKNILAAGLAERLNGRGATRKTTSVAVGCEASTHLNRESPREGISAFRSGWTPKT